MNLQSEVICGFGVSEKRKKVWATELDMLKAFIDVCEKNGLRYFAISGTLLGAVRHNGFIPWDDDIDIGMPRADYEKFLEVGQSFLPPNMFLQCNKTEKRYPTGHAQIRNSDTTCLRAGELERLKAGYNYGIFIDVFPLDDVSGNLKVRKKQADKIAKLRKKCAMAVYPYSSSGIKRFIKKVMSKMYFSVHSLEKAIEDINVTAMQPVTNAEYTGTTSFSPGDVRTIWNKSVFDEAVLHKFEDIEIAIPKRYDDELTTEFGDYMKLPEDLNGSAHGQCFFDTEKPYTEYAKLSYEELRKICENVVL